MKLSNKYIFIRHGQAVSNKNKIVSSWPEIFLNPLTNKGLKQVRAIAQKLEDKNLDLIFSSDILRTKQTAEIIGLKICIKPIFDKRLREYNFGKLNGISEKEYDAVMPDNEGRFNKKIKGGETYKDIQKRMFSFFTEINKKYKNKNILIVSHQVPIGLLLGKIKEYSGKKIFKKYFCKDEIKNAQLIELK